MANYTLPITQPAIGSTNWGGTLNTNFAAIQSTTGLGQINTYSFVTQSSSATLTSAAFGQCYLCTAAITLTLPSVSSYSGTLIAFIMSSSLGSSLVTLDAGSGKTISGYQKRVFSARDFIVIMSNGTDWTIVNQNVTTVYASYYLTTAQALATLTEVQINFDTKVVDTHSAVTTGASWVFTAPYGGVYNVSAGLLYSTTPSTGEARMEVRFNGGVNHYFYNSRDGAANTSPGFCGSKSLKMALGDTFNIFTWHGMGAGISINNSNVGFNTVSITRIGD